MQDHALIYSTFIRINQVESRRSCACVLEMPNLFFLNVGNTGRVFHWRGRRKGGKQIEYSGVSLPPPGAPQSSRQVL